MNYKMEWYETVLIVLLWSAFVFHTAMVATLAVKVFW